MHASAMMYGKLFFETYLKNAQDITIVDVGAQDINGSLRSVVPVNVNYVGLDFEKGKGVDIVITDPYVLPFETESVDAVVSSSCFEHSEFFWLSFNEILRILKPSGLLYLNAPSNGIFHRYPVDCWRFYPDSGVALQNWGKRNGYNCALLESFIGAKIRIWHDFVAVFVKDSEYSPKYPNRIQDNVHDYMNGRSLNSEEITKYAEHIETTSTAISIEQLQNLLLKLKAEQPGLLGKLISSVS